MSQSQIHHLHSESGSLRTVCFPAIDDNVPYNGRGQEKKDWMVLKTVNIVF